MLPEVLHVIMPTTSAVIQRISEQVRNVTSALLIIGDQLRDRFSYFKLVAHLLDL